MKLFYIDNTQCTDCNRCIEMCPTGAIFMVDEKRYVNYDKCTSCGICMKSCNDNAVVLESAGQMLIRLEKAVIYEARIRRLEREMSLLKTRLADVEESLKNTIKNIPVPAFIFDDEDRILAMNRRMSDLVSGESEIVADNTDYMCGERASNILPENIRKLFGNRESVKPLSRVAEINGQMVSVNISPLTSSSMLCFMRDISDYNVATDEILSMLNESITHKMQTVQKIGALLGDEASAEIKGLNAIIKILRCGNSSGDNKNE